MKRYVRLPFGMLAAALVSVALAGCGGGGASSGAPGTPGGPPPPSAAQVLVLGDGGGYIWAYQLTSTGVPPAPAQFTVPNTQMAAGGNIVATIGSSGINVILAKTFDGGSTTYGTRIPINSSSSSYVNGLAVDATSHVYVAVSGGFVVFDSAPGTVHPFARIPIDGSPPATGTIAVAPDQSVAIQAGAFGPGGKVKAVVFNPVAQDATPRGEFSLPTGSLGSPMAFDNAGRLFVDDAGALDVYAVTNGSAKVIATFHVPSGPATLAVDARDDVYVLQSSPTPTQPQQGTIIAYTYSGNSLTKLWSTTTPAGAQWLAVLR